MQKDINVILLGTTGNGRSSTANSILKQSTVRSEGGWNSITHELRKEAITIGDHVISVLDTPGIHGNQEQDSVTSTRTTLAKASSVECYPRGVDAILLVLSYTKRFSQDEIETVLILKKLLPKSWLKTHGIIVFTGGDNFKRDYQGENMDFKTWCGQQVGLLKKMFDECSYRCVMFDNVTKNRAEIDLQQRNLLECIKQCKPRQLKLKPKRCGCFGC